jgi:hypothetical protein
MPCVAFKSTRCQARGDRVEKLLWRQEYCDLPSLPDMGQFHANCGAWGGETGTKSFFYYNSRRRKCPISTIHAQVMEHGQGMPRVMLHLPLWNARQKKFFALEVTCLSLFTHLNQTFIVCSTCMVGSRCYVLVKSLQWKARYRQKTTPDSKQSAFCY